MLDWLNVIGYFGTHRRLLLKSLVATTGPVLELGVGHESTPYLMEFCSTHNRRLVSFETDLTWAKEFPGHDSLYLTSNYEDPLIDETRWGVALIDHHVKLRVRDAIRLAEKTGIVVIHDTDFFDVNHIRPHFKYQLDDDGLSPRPRTTAFSNSIQLDTL